MKTRIREVYEQFTGKLVLCVEKLQPTGEWESIRDFGADNFGRAAARLCAILTSNPPAAMVVATFEDGVEVK